MSGAHTVHYRRTDGTEASALVEGSSWTVPEDCAEITGFTVPGAVVNAVPASNMARLMVVPGRAYSVGGHEEDGMETCQACDRPARGLVLVKASEAVIAGGMARWEPYWTCEVMHRAGHLAPQVQAQDPGALVLVLTAAQALRPGYWTAALGSEL
jgi:hypothetical protein